MWRILLALVQMGRLHFLLGGVLMFFVGQSYGNQASWWQTSFALAMVLFAQVTAHYVNEYADYAADRAIRNRTAFSGGSGVLVSGLVPRRWAMRVAGSTSFLALLCSVVVVFISPITALMGVVALIVSWAYSLPPVRLLSTGWGEVATALTIGGLVPAIGATVGGPPVSSQLGWTVAAFVPIYLVMLLAFELPDVATDVLSGKRVLAIRIGPNTTAALMGALVVAIAGVTATAGLWLLLLTAVPLGALTVGLSVKRRFAWSTLLAVATPTLGAIAMIATRSI